MAATEVQRHEERQRSIGAKAARLRERVKQLAHLSDTARIAALSAIIMGLLDLLEDEL